MKQSKIKLIVLSSIVGLLLSSFNNCAKFKVKQLQKNDNRQQTQIYEIPAPQDNFALLSAEQTFASMLKLTQITEPPASVTNEYNLRYGALAAGNDLQLINAPLLLGSASLAGEVCKTMISKEAALAANTRHFFSGIDFTKGVTTISTDKFNTVVREMAESFWGRQENTQELSDIGTFKTEFISALDSTGQSQATSTSNLILGVCSAMLSSVDALSY